MRPKTAARSLLALCIAFATARAMMHSTDLTFRPSQFHIESADAAGDTGAKAGTVPRSARTRGTVPVFALGIYDVGGKLVRPLREGAAVPGRYHVSLQSGALAAGVYFCTLDNGAKRISKKVVLTE